MKETCPWMEQYGVYSLLSYPFRLFDQNISAIFKHQAFRMKRRYLTNKTATPFPFDGLKSSMVSVLILHLKQLSLLVCKGASCNCTVMLLYIYFYCL